MSSTKPTVVLGATGMLGSEIVRLLCRSKTPVRAVVRPSSHPDKRRGLEAAGAELCQADLKDASSLAAACAGAAAVISTATATVSRQAGDSIESVDEAGQLALIDAAIAAEVESFVFVSFLPSTTDYALQRAKRKVEARLQAGPLAYTILQPADFIEVWLSPALGFDPVHGKATVFGDGRKAVSWISLHDVARFAVAALDHRHPGLARKVLPLGGPDPLSPLDVIDIFRQLGGPPVAVEHVPESALLAQLASATDSLSQAYAAVMLDVARGQVVDPAPALEILPGELTTVRKYAAQLLSSSQTQGRNADG